MLVLYYAPDTCALASHVALEEAGANFSLRRIDLEKSEQRGPEYLSVNPAGRVPALVAPSGVLTETPAILAYVAQSYPAARLAPVHDAFAFSQVQSFNCYLCATLHVAHAHRMRGYRWTDDPEAISAMQRKVPESVAACYAHIEKHLFVGPFVRGEDYTICDPYLFTLAQWMEADGVDPARFPEVAAHRDLVGRRKAVQDALRAESAGRN